MKISTSFKKMPNKKKRISVNKKIIISIYLLIKNKIIKFILVTKKINKSLLIKYRQNTRKLLNLSNYKYHNNLVRKKKIKILMKKK